MEYKILEGLNYALPSLVTGAVAYFMFSGFVKHDTNEKKFKALVEKKKESLPVKLQSYERLLLFCERINPSKLLLRVPPIGEESNEYLHLLLGNIEQEFEHNMVQQLYVSEDVWQAVVASKFAVTNTLSELAKNAKTAKELSENTLKEYLKKESPTEVAVAIIKKEVKKLL